MELVICIFKLEDLINVRAFRKGEKYLHTRFYQMKMKNIIEINIDAQNKGKIEL